MALSFKGTSFPPDVTNNESAVNTAMNVVTVSGGAGFIFELATARWDAAPGANQTWILRLISALGTNYNQDLITVISADTFVTLGPEHGISGRRFAPGDEIQVRAPQLAARFSNVAIYARALEV